MTVATKATTPLQEQQPVSSYSLPCPSCQHQVACDCTTCSCPNHVSTSLPDVQQALDVIGDLYELKAGELGKDDAADASLLDAAIASVIAFVKSEGGELAGEGVAEANHDAFVAELREAGRRNASVDQKRIQQIHDLTHQLGAMHAEEKSEGEPGPVTHKGMHGPMVTGNMTEADTVATTERSAFKERAFSTKQRETLSKTGAAMPDGSYPISNTTDLMNAIHAFGRAKNPDATKAHIIKRAKALGATNMLPADWSASTKETEPFAGRTPGEIVRLTTQSGAQITGKVAWLTEAGAVIDTGYAVIPVSANVLTSVEVSKAPKEAAAQS